MQSVSELANGARPPFSNDSRPPFAGTGWGGGAHDLGRVVSPRFASSHGTVTISQSRDRRSGLPTCQYPEPMALHVALCRHLDHAEQHSAELVRRLRPSPLHRINILVGSGVASRYTQRRLATHLTDQLADQPDTERRALANVSLFTPFDLARQIAARGPSAANPPLPDGADVALLQRVLYELAPQGRLEQFRPDQPGLPAALARTFGDLRDADIDADELAAWALARPQPARDLALVYERWRALLATLNFSDRPAVYQAALHAPPHIWRETLGAAPLIVTGIYDLTRLQRLLIRQAARVTEVHFVALTPDDQDFAYARRAVRRLCRETGTTASEAPGASPALDLVPEAFSAADPQAEAEEIARRILDLARSGVRFHNIAIFHRQGPAADQRLAAALQRAEIPVYRARGLSLRRTAAGRATRQLLRLLWDTPTRSTMLELLGNPAIKREIEAKPILWERISRSAGLVSEWDRMSTQLRTYIEKDELFDHERRLTRELLDRITALSERAAQARDADTWAGAAQQLIAALNEWIETPSAADALAAGVIRSAIGNLGRLDELEITFTDVDFRRAAERALEKAVSRDAGPLTAGVYVGDANGAGRSVRFDAIFIAGLVERTMPAVPRQDPLLSDPQRRDLNEFLEAEVLRLQNERAETDRLAFQLIRQAAREHLTLSWARRSSTVGAPSRPSPLLLSAVGGLAGLLDGPEKLVAEGRIDHLPATVSGAAGPRRRPAQVVETAQEAEDVARDVEAPLRAIDEADLHLALLTTPGVEAQRLLPALWAGAERALAARLRRNAQTFTEYDGVIGLGDEQVAPEHWSASALQRYATCPYRYFLGNVLRLNAVSEPGDDAEISPLERGSLIHRILERWVRGWLEQPDRKPWRHYVADADALHAVANEELAQAEQDQALGLPASAKATREKVLRDLERYRRMQAADAAVGWSPLAVEREFSGVSLPIGGGDSISARGRIDRIDANSGGRLRAVDYKTGKRRAGDLLGHYNGSALQLPLYMHALGRAAERRANMADSAAALHYVTDRGHFAIDTIQGADFVRSTSESAHAATEADQLARTLSTINDGVHEGRFFPFAGDNRKTRENCTYCDFSAACSSDVNSRFAYKERFDLKTVKPFVVMRANKPSKR